jgi:hypothetical protein
VSIDFLPIAMAWNLSGFAFIWLHENHSINAKLSFSKCSTTLSILSSACARVLSSAYNVVIKCAACGKVKNVV